MRLLDLSAGAEVITPALTYVATNAAVLYVGARPVFADIDPTTGNLDPGAVAERMTDRTAALIVVHYGGYPCDLDELYAIATARGVPVIEDCAHATGAVYRGRRVGGHGDVHAFSFNPLKNLATPGGGAVTLRSLAHADRLRRLRSHGVARDVGGRIVGDAASWDYWVPELGYRASMTDVHAAIALVQLGRLEADNGRRAAIAQQYRERLDGVPGVTLPRREPDRVTSGLFFSLFVEGRDQLIDKFEASGIETAVHFRRNDEYPMFETAELPGTEWFWRHEVTLPMHLRLTDDDVEAVCDVVTAGW